MKTKHTPTPWAIWIEEKARRDDVHIVGNPTGELGGTRKLAYMIDTWTGPATEANAAFIVRACNSHASWAKWIVQRGPGLPDHACAECMPGGELVKADFQCVYHEALAAAGAA